MPLPINNSSRASSASALRHIAIRSWRRYTSQCCGQYCGAGNACCSTRQRQNPGVFQSRCRSVAAGCSARSSSGQLSGGSACSASTVSAGAVRGIHRVAQRPFKAGQFVQHRIRRPRRLRVQERSKPVAEPADRRVAGGMRSRYRPAPTR